jgi:DNA-binding SARP family transcriptional activator
MNGKRNQPHRASSSKDDVSWLVRLCLLGNFRLLVAGNLIPIHPGGKSEALLSLLALQSGRRMPRERLVQTLWPASDPALGLRSLNTLVYNLHKLLGTALNGAAPVLHEDGYYRLHTEAGIGVDVTNFDHFIADGDQHLQARDMAAALDAYTRAAALYRGDLCFAADAHTLMERERLCARYLTLLSQLGEYHYQVGDVSTALEYLWQLLVRDPCREDAHRLVMRCYVRRGERAAALHHYQVCADVLRTEFDAAPEAATVALFNKIRLEPDLMMI